MERKREGEKGGGREKEGKEQRKVTRKQGINRFAFIKNEEKFSLHLNFQ